MTDTLQQDEQFPYDEPVKQEAEQSEPEQNTPDLSEINADSEPEQTENTEERRPNKLQERLDKLTAEKYEAKRRADELEAKLKAIEAQKPVITDDIQPPEIPEDTWDTEAMRKYHRDMIQYQRKLAEQAARQTLNSAETEKRQAMQQQQQGEIVRTFAKRAIQSGVDIEQLQQAGTALANAGMAQDLQLLILEDEAGPLITMHLAKNPELANELLSMSPAKAAVKIATQVKAEAVKAKPKVSKAPDPIPEGKPASIVERDDFDKKYKAQWV